MNLIKTHSIIPDGLIYDNTCDLYLYLLRYNHESLYDYKSLFDYNVCSNENNYDIDYNIKHSIDISEYKYGNHKYTLLLELGDIPFMVKNSRNDIRSVSYTDEMEEQRLFKEQIPVIKVYEEKKAPGFTMELFIV